MHGVAGKSFYERSINLIQAENRLKNKKLRKFIAELFIAALFILLTKTFSLKNASSYCSDLFIDLF